MAETGAVVIGVAATGTTGAAETGAVVIGVAETGTTGVAETGAVIIGVAAIGITGITGTAIGTMTMTSSLLVVLAFPGGVGVGALVGAGAIRTDITVTVTHMVTGLATAMAMEATHTDTGMATATAMEATHTTAMATDTVAGAGPELPSYSAASLAPVIITGPLTASWDRERVEQFAHTNRTTATPGNAKFLPVASRASGSFDVLLSGESHPFLRQTNSGSGRGAPVICSGLPPMIAAMRSLNSSTVSTRRLFVHCSTGA